MVVGGGDWIGFCPRVMKKKKGEGEWIGVRRKVMKRDRGENGESFWEWQ